jgi:predicted DNA-binding transcriptional regulator AlpA
MPTKELEELLTETDVHRLTKLSLSNLRRRRMLNQEPRFLKLSHAVRYKKEDIASWIASGLMEPTCKQEGKQHGD